METREEAMVDGRERDEEFLFAMEWGNYEEEEASLGCHRHGWSTSGVSQSGTTRFADVARLNLGERKNIRRETNMHSH